MVIIGWCRHIPTSSILNPTRLCRTHQTRSMLGNSWLLSRFTIRHQQHRQPEKYSSLKLETLFTIPTKKNAPYKKLLLCSLPKYDSTEGEFYQQQLMNLFTDIIENNKDITLQMCPTSEGTERIGNQFILALLFRQILKIASFPLKLSLISYETKTLNLFRF